MDYTAMTAYASAAGAVGGIIAGIALIVTLIYIARELRENARAAHATAYQGHVTNTIAIRLPIVSSPDIAAFFQRHAEDPSSGTVVDRVRWHYAMLMIFRHYDSLLYQHNLGTLENTLWGRFSLALNELLEL